MKILALDPGIGRTGFAIMEKNDNKITPIDYGCIETSPKELLENRLVQIHTYLTRLIKLYQPEVMVLEKVFFNTNQKTAIVVGQAQGVMILSAVQNKMSIEWVTPLQVKQTLTGYGSADKQQVQKMVIILLQIKEIIKLDDTADALACGLTFLSMNKMLQ
ncbi:MAG: crossover junction endodeoxyribonuclease RuvC [Patescibacteria group bacterium]